MAVQFRKGKDSDKVLDNDEVEVKIDETLNGDSADIAEADNNTGHKTVPFKKNDTASGYERKKVDGILARNIDLKNAIKIFSMDRNKETWAPVMNQILKVVHENGMMLVPMTLQKTAASQDILFKIMKGTDGKQFFTLFTSPEEVTKKNPENAAALEFRRLLGEFLKMTDVESLVIDPWSESFILNKEQVKMLLENDQKLFMDRRGIYFDRGNILNIKCDCVVNSADPLFNDGGGVDHDIYVNAGEGLMKRLDEIGSLKLGSAVLTPGYNLNQNFIIHTVGPVFEDFDKDANALASCYLSSLEVAKKVGIHTIAFPAISTGASGFPKDLAAKVAIKAVSTWMDKNKDYGISVIFSCLDGEVMDAYQKVIKEAKPKES